MAETELHPVTYTAEPGIDIEVVKASTKFQVWLNSLDRTRFDLRGVHFQSIDFFHDGKVVGFIKFKTVILDEKGEQIKPGIVFMRGGSVAILTILKCKGKRYSVMTLQPRVPTGCFAFCEIPAGTLDDSGDFGGVAAKEVEEELGLKIAASDLIDLTEEIGWERGYFVSPGGCDETIRIFLYEKEVTEEELAAMNGKATGVIEEGEQITLKIVPFDDTLLQYPDSKTVIAYTLYNKLRAAA